MPSSQGVAVTLNSWLTERATGGSLIGPTSAIASSRSTARRYPKVHCAVQNLPGAVADGPTAVPAEYSNRITFMVNDMVQEQPVRDADVYFFRYVFHNWPDASCIKILQALIPALKPGARVVINDSSMPNGQMLQPCTNRTGRSTLPLSSRTGT
ncbi:hypothetical protein ANO11243_091740 [Dothideomycetidae sp. 11243]|nr:hypothetical protein ANO11243_091740 [fungal sp. No.11243]